MKKNTQSSVLARQPLATLGKVTVIALVGCACASGFLLLQIGQIIVPIVIVDVFLLIVAALIMTGIRWMPLLGSGDALGTMIGGLVTQQYFSYHLTHPDQLGLFSAALLVYAFGLVTVVAGISATVQNYRGRYNRPTPRLLAPLLTGITGFVVGAIIVSLLVQPTGATSNSTTTVHMGVNTFSPAIVTVQKGSKLSLVDDGSFFHIIDNGTWVNNTEHVSKELNAPLVNNKQVNGQGNTVDVGPFNTAGTYHIFCSVHPGMNLTVIVQ